VLLWSKEAPAQELVLWQVPQLLPNCPLCLSSGW
jgi:hypothetical protein